MWYFSYTVILLIQGDAVYLATVYFIKPELICSPGRSKEDFDDQGTGNVLWLKKKDGTFLKAPLEMDDADEGVSTHLTLILEIIILCDILIHNTYFRMGAQSR